MRTAPFTAFLAFAVTLAVPAQAEQSYVWDGSSLRPVQTTQGITCSNWAAWYFKRGVSQTPGSQWGAAIEQSAEGVLKDQRESLRLEKAGNAVNAKYHLKGPEQHLYENYLGPICVTKTAFDAKPGAILAIENVGQLAGRISALIRLVRTILNSTSMAPTSGYQGYYLQESSKTQLEQYLDNIQAISIHVHQLQDALMQRLGPAMMQINGGIDTVTAQLGRAEADLPAIRKLVSTQSPPAISTAWMSKAGSINGDYVTTVQAVPGGFSVAIVWRGSWTQTQGVQYENIKDVTVDNKSVLIHFKVMIRTTDSKSSPYDPQDSLAILFNSNQDAQDAFSSLHAQIR